MASLVDSWDVGSMVFYMSVSPDGASVGVGSSDAVTVWDISTGKTRLGPLKGHTGEVWSLEFSPDGHTLASGSTDKTIRVWDMETGMEMAQPFKGHTRQVTSATFSRDSRHILSGSHDGTIRLWDARTGKSFGTFIDESSEVHLVAVSPTSEIVISACADGTIKAYDMISRAVLFKDTGSETTVAFSPDGARIAYASRDRTVRIWDAATGRAIGQPLNGHTDRVVWVAFSPDGRYIASASEDTSVRIWNAETGALHGGPLLGHTGLVRSVGFALNGSCVVSGSWDCSIKKWDMRNLGIQTSRLEQTTETGFVGFEISQNTTPEEIMSLLSVRGCRDMTNQLDLPTCSKYPISSGGFGDIYRCKLKNNIEVAIKVVRVLSSSGQDHKVLKYAARELYTWSKCKHPNVQPLLGLVMFRDQIGMIARWELNGNLTQYLEQHAGLDRCAMSVQIAKGLSYLHASGVVHGDLKAANILVSQDGIPQLADFGNAKLLEYTLMFTRSSTGETFSSRWAAPEMFEGAPCSYATDVYALGMTILEVITGEMPWAGRNERAVLYAVTVNKTCPERPEARMPTESKHGDILWALLRSCWKLKPQQRIGVEEIMRIMETVTQDGLKDE